MRKSLFFGISIVANLCLGLEMASAEVMPPDRFAECALASATVDSLVSLRNAHPVLTQRMNVSGDEEKSFKLYSDFFANTYIKTRIAAEKPNDMPVYASALMAVFATGLTNMTSAMARVREGEPEEAADLFDAQRTVFLACVKEVGGNALSTGAPAPETATKDNLPSASDMNETWTVKTETSRVRDTVDVFLEVRSKEAVQCRRFGSAQRVILQLRCMENTTAVLVYGTCHFASGFGGYGEVDLRIDDEKAFTTGMEASTDGRAIGLFSGRKSIPLAKRLLGKTSLIVRATPYNQSPVTVEFPLEGLDQAIKPLRESCAW